MSDEGPTGRDGQDIRQLDDESIHDGQSAGSADVVTHETDHSTELETTFGDPGLPMHVYRHSDIDPKAAKRREREVATLFGLSTLGTLLFIVAFFAVKPNDASGAELMARVGLSTKLLGLGLGFALFCIGAGAIHWAKTLMPDDEIVTERKPMRSSDEDREAAVAAVKEGAAGAGLGRRKLIRNSLLGAMAPLGLLAIIPLRDLGPLPSDSLDHTAWRAGRRIVSDPAGHPIRAAEVEIGSVVHVLPEGIELSPNRLEQEAKATAILIRLPPDEIRQAQPDRKGWDVGGIVVYSKVCTHLGCAVGLYEQQTHHLLCPCHQSTFDVPRNCKVIFGPAHRPLPQLKITTDAEGYLVAAQDFQEPVGPSFWERGN